MNDPASLLHFTYAYAALALASLVTSAVLLSRGLRRRHAVRSVPRGHPQCSGCGYDLFGLDDAANRCPECGADLRAHRTTRPIPRWRWWAGMSAGALLLAAGLIGSLKALNTGRWALAQKQNQPASWVIAELAGPDHTRAMWEIQRRLDANELSPAQIDSLVGTIADVQASEKFGDTWPWSTLIEDLHDRNRISDVGWRRYANTAVELYNYECRAQVRRGEPVPFTFTFRAANHIPQGIPLSFTYFLKRVEVDGAPLALEGTSLANVGSATPEHVGGYHLFTDVLLIPPNLLEPLRLTEGPHRLRIVVDVDIYNGARPSPGDLPLISRELSGEQPWTLVAPDAQTVELVRNQRVDGLMSQVIFRPKLRALADRDGAAILHTELEVAHRDMAVAISVWARAAGQQWLCGREAFHEVQPCVLRNDRRLENFDADRVDVIVRPDPDGARLTPKVTQIWGGEIVFRDVPVQWVTADGKPASRPTTTSAR